MAANGPKEPGSDIIVDLQAKIDGDRARTEGELTLAQLYAQLGLATDRRGRAVANLANAVRTLERHPIWRSRIYYDEFRREIRSEASNREWSDPDTLWLATWMQETMGFAKIAPSTVALAMEAVSARQARHPLRLWLERLEWDQTPRVERFCADAFGVVQTAYSAAVGNSLLISMVARVLDPGCQVDTMLVLEGPQGFGKSSALAALGGDYYKAMPHAFGSRDFLQALDGVWIAEIPDLSGFRGRDVEHVKALITIREDRYRRSYARLAGSWKRQCVFAATANRDDWQEDETGGRRFLPLRCIDINLTYIREQREQLFAEALILYRGGASWWDIPPGEAKREQDERAPDDPWESPVLFYAGARVEVVVPEILTHALEIDPGQHDKCAQMRVAAILRRAGWKRTTVWAGGKPAKRWLPPLTTS